MQEILFLIALNFILFFRSLRYSICIDDIRYYMSIQKGAFDNQKIKNPIDLINFIKNRLYGGGTFGRAKPGEAPDVHIDHTFGLILHTLTACLVFLAFHSFWAAVLYSCNPTNLQTSVWLNGRRYLINVILVLLIVMFPIAGTPLFIASGLFHVTAIFSPVLFLGWFTIPAGLIFYGLFWKQINAKIKDRFTRLHADDWKIFSANRLIVTTKCYGFYFWKMFFPFQTLINYPDLFWWGVTKQGNDDAYSFNFDFYVGILATIVSVVMLVFVPAQYKSFVVFMILATLQWCAIIPATQTLADRYVSTALPFAMFFLAYFVTSPVVLSAIAGFYAARLWSSMEIFTDIFHYFKYQLYHAPQITTPRKDIINYFTNNQNPDFYKALFYCREGLEYAPNDFALLHAAAISSRACGLRQNARKFVERARENLYIGNEEAQLKWCDSFLAEMKKEDMAQLRNGKKK